ncbi:MAG: glycosyltransferase [Acidobacteriota bacterium]
MTTSSDSQAPFVSVLMPVRDEEAFIARSLGAVLAQSWPADRLEVLVLDGRSTDSTRSLVDEIAARSETSIRLLDNPGRTAPCALNVGLRAARGEILVRVDGHCEIGTDYVERGVHHLLADGVDGVGGPLATVPLDPNDPVAETIAVAMGSPFGVGGSAFRVEREGRYLRPVDTVAFPAYRRKAVEAAGLFDEELLRNQDDEYNYRLRKLGYVIALAGDMPARYYARSSWRKLWRQYRQYGMYKVRVLQKHPRQMRGRQFVPAAFVGALIGGILALPRLGARPLALVVGAYLLANLVATDRTLRARAHRRGELRWRLPRAFALMHVGYGVGFLQGLVRFAGRWRD